jgi:UDP-N-acetylmuramyl tripeptide synthase
VETKGGARRIDPRLAAALAASRLTATSIRRLGRGGGTSAPGLVAERIDPAILTKLTAGLTDGAIVVAGTNGKTTTSRMIADILEVAGHAVIHNRSGSNLVRGVVTAFAGHASLTGRIGAGIAVIESDEAAFPAVVRLTRPRIILLNNLFRDQLDRYGELDTIVRSWRGALETLDASTTIVINADDPSLVALTDGLRARLVRFGLDDPTWRLDTLPHAVDSTSCRWCGADLDYGALYVSHLGDWRCAACGRRRPELDMTGRAIDLRGVESLAMTVDGPGGEGRIEIGVPGLYNAYNVLAAVTVARVAGVPDETIATALAAFRSAFGRIERVTYRNRTLTLALVKNPVGFNEVLRMLTMASGGLTVPTLIAINDRDADGRDVSWLWDVDFELLAPGDVPLFTTGIRGTDMGNRLKYAGVPPERITPLPDDLAKALDQFVAAAPEGSTAYILPTYTAMLDLRQVLADLGAVETFWKQ